MTYIWTNEENLSFIKYFSTNDIKHSWWLSKASFFQFWFLNLKNVLWKYVKSWAFWAGSGGLPWEFVANGQGFGFCTIILVPACELQTACALKTSLMRLLVSAFLLLYLNRVIISKHEILTSILAIFCMWYSPWRRHYFFKYIFSSV